MISLLTISQFPVVAILAYVYLRDKHEKEPLMMLFKCFFGGMLAVVLAASIELWLGISHGETQTWKVAVSAFMGVALVEELSKYLFVRWIAFKSPAFNEPYDGIMYCVAVSLGFAALENLGFVMQHGVAIGFVRMFSAVPMHAMAGVLMGFYIGAARFAEPIRAMDLVFTGIFAATITHGTYDYFLMLGNPLLIPLSIVVLIIQIYFSRKAIRLHNKAFPRSSNDQPVPEELVHDELRWARVSLVGITVFGIASSAAVGVLAISTNTVSPDVKAGLSLLIVFSLGAAILGFVLHGGMTKGNRLCWHGAALLFFLLLPTPAFPLGLSGLYGLYHPNARLHFAAKRTPTQFTT